MKVRYLSLLFLSLLLPTLAKAELPNCPPLQDFTIHEIDKIPSADHHYWRVYLDFANRSSQLSASGSIETGIDADKIQDIDLVKTYAQEIIDAERNNGNNGKPHNARNTWYCISNVSPDNYHMQAPSNETLKKAYNKLAAAINVEIDH